ncbi:MAG: tetratricopeptide repeat protein [Aquificae bacterium]|nr:tetratricopeptide repeat protein [Aquificota bacterium]
MLKRSITILLTLILYAVALANQQTALEKKVDQKIRYTKQQLKEFEQLYKEALTMYKRGSYYTALNILARLTKDSHNPYYPQALFLTAKIYLHLGVKTGIKEFLQKALYYLNTYSYVADNPYTWEFYYTKGQIYENLFMYERALASYKMAFRMADTPKKQFETVIGILRTAAWQKKMDIITRYIILVNLEELSEKERKEFEFVKGLVEFQKGNYKEAMKLLIPVYKEYEQYLIENPNYYLILGETAYRVGDYQFAKQIFRRMISLVKDETVIRKALLRLGDIALKTGDRVLAFNYYYEVIKKYPNTPEATISKLKLIALERYEDIRKKLFLIGDKDYIDPLPFVLKTLVSNRNNYVGFFALGNFGYIALSSGSKKLFEKLLWELSLVNVSRMKYEHKEYIRDLWSPEIKKLDYKTGCKLFLANKKFFLEVFDKKTLKLFYRYLQLCGKLDEAMEVAKFMVERWKDDEGLLLLAEAYLDRKEYQKSLQVLKKVKHKGCRYYILLAKNQIFTGKVDRKLLSSILKVCKKISVERNVVLAYLYLQNGKPEKAVEYVNQIIDLFPDYYRINQLGRILLERLIYALFDKGMYKQALKILLPISEKLGGDCDINSWVVISAVRVGDGDTAERFYKKIENCNNQWSIIAKNVYQDFLVLKELKNE